MRPDITQAYDIIVLGGQSNAEGHGIGDASEDYIPDERILWLNDHSRPRFEASESGSTAFCIDYPAAITLAVADEPCGEHGKVGKFSFFFAKDYIANGLLRDGRKLLIINAAVGGTGFCRNEWGTEGILYRRLRELTQHALSLNPENRLVAFLWHQGECDAFERPKMPLDKKFASHKTALGNMLNDFIVTFNCPALPFIFGGFCDEWYLKNKPACDAVLQAIQEVAKMHNSAFVNTEGLKSNNQQTQNGDDIHFSRDSLHILGSRMFDAYRSLL